MSIFYVIMLSVLVLLNITVLILFLFYFAISFSFFKFMKEVMIEVLRAFKNFDNKSWQN